MKIVFRISSEGDQSYFNQKSFQFEPFQILGFAALNTQWPYSLNFAFWALSKVKSIEFSPAKVTEYFAS